MRRSATLESIIAALLATVESRASASRRLTIVAGALSVGIGFGLQSIVGNFVSGLILLWERAIRVGDWVVVGDEQGYVRRINVRSTEIETFDRATMIVPNSNLITGIVKNWLRGDRVGRIKLALSPHSGVDPEMLRDIMLAAARAQEDVLRIPAPQVMFLGMEASGFKFELWCYVDDVEKSSRVRSDLHFDLHRRLSEAGITMAGDVRAGQDRSATPRTRQAGRRGGRERAGDRGGHCGARFRRQARGCGGAGATRGRASASEGRGVRKTPPRARK